MHGMIVQEENIVEDRIEDAELMIDRSSKDFCFDTNRFERDAIDTNGEVEVQRRSKFQFNEFGG